MRRREQPWRRFPHGRRFPTHAPVAGLSRRKGCRFGKRVRVRLVGCGACSWSRAVVVAPRRLSLSPSWCMLVVSIPRVCLFAAARQGEQLSVYGLYQRAQSETFGERLAACGPQQLLSGRRRVVGVELARICLRVMVTRLLCLESGAASTHLLSRQAFLCRACSGTLLDRAIEGCRQSPPASRRQALAFIRGCPPLTMRAAQTSLSLSLPC